MCNNHGLDRKYFYAIRNTVQQDLQMTPKEEKLAWILEKKKIRQRYVFLTEKDLAYEEGKKDVMLGKLQKRLGKTKEQLLEIIAAL